MPILLTWNPSRSEFHKKLPAASKTTLSGGIFRDWWGVGKRKKIPVGTRTYLLRQAKEPKGIVGSGWTISEPYERELSGNKRVVDVAFDLLLDPDKFPPLDVRQFKEELLSAVHWATQSSGISVPDELEPKWREHVTSSIGHPHPSLNMDLVDSDEQAFPEGRGSYRLHRHIERNTQLVKEAKARAKQTGQLRCWVEGCGFDFLKAYGEDYIEAHHTIPISELPEDGATDIKDIALVCSNCHRMLHRRRPWLTINELSKVLDKNW